MKLHHLFLWAMAIALGLACGSSGSSSGSGSTTTVSYSGSADESLIENDAGQTDYLVKAYVTGSDVVTSEASFDTRSDDDIAGDIDFEYTLTGLTAGTEYTIKVEKDDIVAISTVVTAEEASNDKPRDGSTLAQINIYTTVVADLYETALDEGEDFSVEAAVREVFGVDNAFSLDVLVIQEEGQSLAEVFSENTTLSTITLETTFTTAIQNLTTNIVSVAQALTAADDVEGTLLTRINEMKELSRNVFKEVAGGEGIGNAAGNDSDFRSDYLAGAEALEVQIKLVVPAFVFDLGVLGSEFDGLSPTDDDFEEKFEEASLDGFAPAITSIGLADSSFGVQSGNSFTVSTLEPVFEICFEGPKAMESLSSNVTLMVTKGSVTKELSASSPAADFQWKSDMSKLYIAVVNDSSVGTLAPGESYAYKIMIDPGVVKVPAASLGGTITTMDVTITSSEVGLSFEGTPWNGVEFDDVSFQVDVKEGSSIAVLDSSREDLGLVSSLSVSGLTGTYSDGDFVVTSSDSNGTTLTTATLGLSSSLESVLQTATYTVTPTLNLQYSNGTALTAGTDYASSLRVTVRGEVFTLQILHSADADGDGDLINNTKVFSAMLNHFRSKYNNNLTLYSGDAWIPGSYYSASSDSSLADLLGIRGDGRAHVAYLNAMGFQASVFGNHEFDQGTSAVVDILTPEMDPASSATWMGADFPYLSYNIDFSTDSSMADHAQPNGLPASSLAGKFTGYTYVQVGGEKVGIIGVTTPTLPNISSPGDLTITPSTTASNADIAAVIQVGVDELEAMGVNKIILLAHMQQISVEYALAGLLDGVDVIIGGGSNSVLLDDNDRARSGHTSVGTYPQSFTDAGGDPCLVVNVDGDYEYLGRLVVNFDEDGVIDTSALDTNVNGAYATDSQMLTTLGITEADGAALVTSISEAILDVVEATEGNIFGSANVFLNGERGSVRTEETNLGNLSADANKWMAQQTDSTVVVSIKNGGGIRASIGQQVVLPGGTEEVSLLPTAEIPGVKEEGEISQTDIATTLRFNNSLTLLTVTATQLKQIIEHGVAASADGATPGRFPQVSGMSFTYSTSGTAQVLDDAGAVTTAGTRVTSLTVGDDDVVVSNGTIQGDASRTYRIVTLGFLAGGGDGYPFPSDSAANVVDLEEEGKTTGDATFADNGTEQDALAEYLLEFYSSTPFGEADTATDARIIKAD